MSIKQKRFYIDRSESDKIIFITSGRRNKMIEDVEMSFTEPINESRVRILERSFQIPHSLECHNSMYLKGANLEQCGFDTKYRFFWSHCVDAVNPHYHCYGELIAMMKNQRN